MGMDAARRDGWVLQTPGRPKTSSSARARTAATRSTTTRSRSSSTRGRCVHDSMNFYFQPVSWAAVATCRSRT